MRHHGIAKQRGEASPTKRLAQLAEEVPAGSQGSPFFAEFERDREVVNRGPRTAMITAVSILIVEV
jgi:hypothetical protein